MGKEKTRPKVEKSRYWAICVYPESAVADWREILSQYAVPCAISPLHDRDVYDEDKYDGGVLVHKKGDLLKPHYHVLFAFEGPTTEGNILKLSERCGGTKHAEKVGSAKGYYEYLWHKNEHDKHQYNEEDVVTLCGFNVADFGLSTAEADKILAGLIGLIRVKGWTEYRSLMDYLMDNEMWPEFRVARCQTIFFREYIRGCWRESEQFARRTDPATGEVRE